MSKTLQLYVPKRDWRMHCYDTNGEIRVCVIDSDHGSVQIGLVNGELVNGEQEQSFELRVEQATKFQVALEATWNLVASSGSDGTACWEGRCHNRWGELSDCLIEVSKPGAVRISCVTAQTDERECSLELRQEHIGEFRAALAAAMEVFHADVAIHGKHWADDAEGDDSELKPIGDEKTFTREINAMVAEDAPQMLALVAEIGDRVDAMTMAWCMKFPDRTEVISADSNGVRGGFRSVERACRVLSAQGKVKVRVVAVTEARKQANAA